MKKILLIVAVLLSGAAIYAKQKLPEFGKIDLADLQMKECAFDKGADAMNLIKTENVSFDADNMGTPRTETEYRIRIKIFKETGFSNASIVIPYPGRSVKITDIEAYLYNLDGDGNIVIQKIDKDQIFREKSKSKKSQNSIRFTFAGLKAGSVIEYRYTRIDKYDIRLKPWVFQGELPSRYMNCTLVLPAFMRMDCRFITSLPIEKDSSVKYEGTRGEETTRAFTIRNVPAFKAEPFMGSLADNLQHIEFAPKPKSIYSSGNQKISWSVYNNVLLFSHYFGLQFDKEVAGTAGFVDSVKAMKQTADKINALYGYVKRNITWNGEQTFFSEDLDDCWTEKSGSSGEMNILLLNLFRKVGIHCFPLLISTRENGKLDQSFPSLGQFNGVDVLVFDSNHTYVLDCTQKNLSYTNTPYNVLNSAAFMIDKDNGKWVNLVDNRSLMNTQLYVSALMDSTGTLKGSGQMIFTGIAKAETLAEEAKEEKKKSNTTGLVDNDASELKIDSSSSVHNNDDNDTLVHNITFHTALSNTDDIYFLNPFLFSMFEKNPFRDTARYSDIDFGSSQSYNTSLNVVVPPGFAIEETPKSVLIRMPDSSVMFKREIFSSSNQVLIRNSFNINRALFEKEEYRTLKTFFDKVYVLINEQIVLKKKENQ